jgi:hypothetical protein
MMLPLDPHLPITVGSIVSRLRGGNGRALGAGGGTSAETVGELAGDSLEVSHASGTGGLPSLGLLAPVDYDLVNSSFVDYSAMLAVDIHLRVLAAGYPHEEQVCFWMWRERRPANGPVSMLSSSAAHPIHQSASSSLSAPVLGPDIQNLGYWQRTATPAQRVRLVVALAEAGSSLSCIAQSVSKFALYRGVAGRAYSL